MDRKKQIRDFILENYLFTNEDSALSNDQSLLEAGIIDSTGILELIAFLQETFGLTVDDDEMIPDNFDSVDRIVSYVSRKKNG